MKYLIAGLGNVGGKYENTRHNAGFLVLDQLAEMHKVSFDLERFAFQAQFRHKSREICLIKPTTYMNLSGKAVRYWMQFLKIPPENLLVVVDDKDIDFGKLRLRTKGSDGGHNGLKDITQALGNSNYARLRFGIGDNFGAGRQIDYVLGEWTKQELMDLNEHTNRAAQAVESFCTIGVERTMNLFN